MTERGLQAGDEIDLPASLQTLAERGVRKTFRKGHRIIEEGDEGGSIYIILKGRVRVFAEGDSGRVVTYGSFGPGEYVGEMSLDGGLRSASVEAIEPLTCVQVSRPILLAHFAQSPEFALELLSKVIHRARAATMSARQMALSDVYGRLSQLLSTLSTPRPDGTRQIARRLTHQEIAGHLGCTREMIGRIFRDLEKGGYLIRGSKELVLQKPLPPRW